MRLYKKNGPGSWKALGPVGNVRSETETASCWLLLDDLLAERAELSFVREPLGLGGLSHPGARTVHGTGTAVAVQLAEGSVPWPDARFHAEPLAFEHGRGQVVRVDQVEHASGPEPSACRGGVAGVALVGARGIHLGLDEHPRLAHACPNGPHVDREKLVAPHAELRDPDRGRVTGLEVDVGGLVGVHGGPGDREAFGRCLGPIIGRDRHRLRDDGSVVAVVVSLCSDIPLPTVVTVVGVGHDVAERHPGVGYAFGLAVHGDRHPTLEGRVVDPGNGGLGLHRPLGLGVGREPGGQEVRRDVGHRHLPDLGGAERRLLVGLRRGVHGRAEEQRDEGDRRREGLHGSFYLLTLRGRLRFLEQTHLAGPEKKRTILAIL